MSAYAYVGTGREGYGSAVVVCKVGVVAACIEYSLRSAIRFY